MSNWLITGGLGFIATNLVHKILSSDNCENIYLLDNAADTVNTPYTQLSSDIGLHGHPNIKHISSSVSNTADLSEIISACDYVVHLAAQTGVPLSIADPFHDAHQNILTTLKLLESCRGTDLKKIILASSSAPLGLSKPPISESSLPRPISPYGVSKLAVESYGLVYNHLYRLPTISLRFSNVYGPYSLFKSSVVASMIRSALSKLPITIYGDGSATRDFLYVDDLVSAIIKSCEVSIDGELFQIASGKQTSVQSLASRIAYILHQKYDIPASIIYTDSRAGDIVDSFSCIDKARNVLKWQPSTTLDIGLERTVDYFISTSRSSEHELGY